MRKSARNVSSPEGYSRHPFRAKGTWSFTYCTIKTGICALSAALIAKILFACWSSKKQFRWLTVRLSVTWRLSDRMRYRLLVICRYSCGKAQKLNMRGESAGTAIHWNACHLEDTFEQCLHLFKFDTRIILRIFSATCAKKETAILRFGRAQLYSGHLMIVCSTVCVPSENYRGASIFT